MEKVNEVPRSEYPKPQLKRKTFWLNLNGYWDFEFDDDNIGIRKRWFKKEGKRFFKKQILVPFCYQCKLSEIQDNAFHDIVWYRRKFSLPNKLLKQKIFLNCGAIDYYCYVYINGYLAGFHEGGFTSFQIDISDFVKKENEIVIRVEDPSKNVEIPRGKQFWEKNSKWIFYPRVTGIWQTIWIESTNPKYYIKEIKIDPDIDNHEIIIEPVIKGIGNKNLILSTNVSIKNEIVSKSEITLDFLGRLDKKIRDKSIIKEKKTYVDRLFKTNPLNQFRFRIIIPPNKLYLWSPKQPFLYDLEMSIIDKKDDKEFDKVSSYFGMRKISVSEPPINNKVKIGQKEFDSYNKLILLNNEPIYQKLFLVQGYWEESFYTPPSEEAIKKDIDLVKEFGFNGIRTHQKVFDPRFLYWCDKKGVLVWSEIGSMYAFSHKSQQKFLNQYLEMVNRDFNHPSIIVWTLLNEGWGVPGAEYDSRKLNYILALYYLIKSIDPTRLIIDDDGWYHTKTDIATKHFYWDLEKLPKDYEEEIKMDYPQNGHPPIYIGTYRYNKEPIIYSEIGGYAYDYYGDIKNPIGYGMVQSEEILLKKVVTLLEKLDKQKEWIHGFCYTELYDQFQEINGLLTINRIPKIPPKLLKREIDKLFY
ncbi:MAG: glycoside hydrolase family 2 TIM barrel-domain containing protein [Candidatus Lokiarchaeota archaeon]